MSRPRFEPTAHQRQQVETLTGLMINQETIARNLQIDLKTLRKYFRVELDHGRENTVKTLKSVIFNAANNGSIRAASYLLDRMGIWSTPENDAVLRDGRNGTTIIIRGGLAAVQQEPKPNGHDVVTEPEA
jgi:hypothetical protein